MKKVFILLAIVGVVRIVVLLYYDTKLLEHPIVIALDADPSSSTMHVSYITNRTQPVQIQYIEAYGMQLYPHNESFFSPFFDLESQQPQSYADYSYYSIHTASMSMNLEEMDMNMGIDNGYAILYFDNGHRERVAVRLRDQGQQQLLEQTMSSVGTTGTEAIYYARQPITIQELHVAYDRVKLKQVKFNNTEVSLPLEKAIKLDEGDSLYIATTDGVALYPFDFFTIELIGLDATNKPFTISVGNNLNEQPKKDWVMDVVKERGNQ